MREQHLILVLSLLAVAIWAVAYVLSPPTDLVSPVFLAGSIVFSLHIAVELPRDEG